MSQPDPIARAVIALLLAAAAGLAFIVFVCATLWKVWFGHA